MPKYPLPNTSLPKTTLLENDPVTRTGPGSDTTGNAVQLLPPARPPEQPAPLLRRAGKGVYQMLKRLRSSYLRSEAVRESRMDAALNGRDGYLLLHYFNSVK
ncbi:hypothetical protein [Arthrobacter yangruifuii]|uniref:hypothetical protein n=1 Tax=Arthrobacter yangruifuii TaxID=2606616 RepID=UPI0011B391CA|nr:hypothetical protein [Arthrobacter yangruifuii]